MSYRTILLALLAALLGLAGCATQTQPAPKAASAPAADTPPARAATPPAPISVATAGNMANNCFACHGPNGVSPGAIPSLHNMTAKNISDMLRAFRAGERPSTVMGRHAKGYTDAEIEALAKYIAGLNGKH